MERFEEIHDKWLELNNQLYTESKNYIKGVLEKSNDNKFEFDIENDYVVDVSYNGGNHPEYASNCYSVVSCVYLKNGNIYLDIDDTDEYDIDEISANELYFVADMMKSQLEGKE